MRTLLKELSRRRVFRVDGIYGIVAWVMTEVADVVFPARLDVDETAQGGAGLMLPALVASLADIFDIQRPQQIVELAAV